MFGVIERFSEDVDLSFDRAGLGFGGESDPLNATTGKKRKHGLEALTETCQRAIRERLLPQLVAAFGDALGEPPSAAWGLDLDEDDPDGQTLLFRYPAGDPVPLGRRTGLHPARCEAGDRGTLGSLASRRSERHVLRGGSVPRRVQGGGMQGPCPGRRADVLGEGYGAPHVAPRAGGEEVPGPAVAALL